MEGADGRAKEVTAMPTSQIVKSRLSLENVDEIDALLSKCHGLADLLQSAGEFKAEVTGPTLAATAVTMRDMLAEARELLQIRTA